MTTRFVRSANQFLRSHGQVGVQFSQQLIDLRFRYEIGEAIAAEQIQITRHVDLGDEEIALYEAMRQQAIEKIQEGSLPTGMLGLIKSSDAALIIADLAAPEAGVMPDGRLDAVHVPPEVLVVDPGFQEGYGLGSIG